MSEPTINVFFYSPKCSHSKKLLDIIQSNNHLKSTYILEDIHTSKHPAIRQLRSVPAIYIQSSSNIIVGSKAYEHIDNELQLHLNAFEDNSTFSFIDDSTGSSSTYAYLSGDGYDVPTSQDAKQSSNQGNNSKEKQQLTEYEEFLEKRKQDVPSPFKRT